MTPSPVEEAPSPTTRQLSGRDDKGRAILSVLTKRTYQIAPDGRCEPAPEQRPLLEEPVADLDNDRVLAWDTDLFPFKVATDLVVKGHVFNPRDLPQVDASVTVGPHGKRLRVVGDRRCTLSATGRILFSPPGPFTKMPVSYARAYGGRDAVAEKKHGNPWLPYASYLTPPVPDLDGASPFLYPRNLAGVGYLVEATAEAVEALRLPNIEDPLDLLSPDRLIAGDPGRWTVMPMPAGTDWFDYAWFPRIAYAGMVPDADPPDGPVPEIARGLVASDILAGNAADGAFSTRLANGASLGLQLPYFRGGEAIRLEGFDAGRPVVVVKLPTDKPALSTDGRNGRLNPTEPVIQTVVLEPDDARVTVVWRGCAPALRFYTPEELAKMPLRVAWR